MTDTIITGPALDILRSLPSQSIHCCITSPPYWGLRDMVPLNGRAATLSVTIGKGGQEVAGLMGLLMTGHNATVMALAR